MKSRILIFIGLTFLISFAMFNISQNISQNSSQSISGSTSQSSPQSDLPKIPEAEIPADASVASFAGGCFWCIETAFENQEGVYAAISGYAEGSKEDAQYSKVSRGSTDHREAAQVHYDPTVTSYENLLEIFWRQIDPTDAGGQFADRGYHYTTAIYYHNEEQKIAAEKSKKALVDSAKFDDPIVTEILPFSTFFPAEEEHQNFAQKRAAYYQSYKKGSGRSSYIEETWQD